MKLKKSNKNPQRLGNRIIFAGSFIVLLSFVLLGLIFVPLVKQEIGFIFRSNFQEVGDNDTEGSKNSEEVIPEDENFSIVIPKIGANSKVIKNVSAFNQAEYRSKLKEGVAHTKGTVYPGMDGNIFLFAHSSDDFYRASRYNTVFYLLTKLEKNDQFYIVYNKKRYNYRILEKKIVTATDVRYLTPASKEKTVTLMTCWPAGTSWKRLLVFAEEIEQ